MYTLNIMSTDIQKIAVCDPRVVQNRPKYGISVGPASNSNSVFSAIAATASQLTFNIYVPSETVYLHRNVSWAATVLMSMTVTVPTTLTVGDSIVVPGRDFALCAFPLNQMCSTMSTTINDATSTINTADVLNQVMRLCDDNDTRLCRTTPSMLDKYQNYNDAFGTQSNPLGGFDASPDPSIMNNGAFSQLLFTTPTGSPLGASGVAYGGATYNTVNNVPVIVNNTLTSYTIYFKFRSTEPIILPPFAFGDEACWETGFFGLNNCQLVCNLVSSGLGQTGGGIGRIVRASTRGLRTISNVAFNTNTPIVDARLNCQFLTPPLSVPLPPKSVVPYMEFPRYISVASEAILPGATKQVSSSTITLPSIPDLLLIYCKPTTGYSQQEADWVFPVASSLATSGAGVYSPLSIQFDNFSGLCSTHSTEELYNMSVRNGLRQDYNSWSGSAHSAGSSYPTEYGPPPPDRLVSQIGQRVPTVGGMLVLKPGVDFGLQTGQSSSLVGNFTLQVNLQITNTHPVEKTPQLFIIAVNSGFWESIRGSSRIVKALLSEQDILSAPMEEMVDSTELKRLVGGFSFGSLSNIISKAKNLYDKSKPAISAAVSMLPDDDGVLGKVKRGAKVVGYGSGGGSGGRKKSLEARLM